MTPIISIIVYFTNCKVYRWSFDRSSLLRFQGWRLILESHFKFQSYECIYLQKSWFYVRSRLWDKILIIYLINYWFYSESIWWVVNSESMIVKVKTWLFHIQTTHHNLTSGYHFNFRLIKQSYLETYKSCNEDNWQEWE